MAAGKGEVMDPYREGHTSGHCVGLDFALNLFREHIRGDWTAQQVEDILQGVLDRERQCLPSDNPQSVASTTEAKECSQ